MPPRVSRILIQFQIYYSSQREQIADFHYKTLRYTGNKMLRLTTIKFPTQKYQQSFFYCGRWISNKLTNTVIPVLYNPWEIYILINLTTCFQIFVLSHLPTFSNKNFIGSQAQHHLARNRPIPGYYVILAPP